MNEKVVSLRGDLITATSDAQKDVVEALEQLIAKAKAGELQCFAYAGVFANGDMGDDWFGNATQMQLLAAVTLLFLEYSKATVEAE